MQIEVILALQIGGSLTILTCMQIETIKKVLARGLRAFLKNLRDYTKKLKIRLKSRASIVNIPGTNQNKRRLEKP
jgi:hypothetical protein